MRCYRPLIQGASWTLAKIDAGRNELHLLRLKGNWEVLPRTQGDWQADWADDALQRGHLEEIEDPDCVIAAPPGSDIPESCSGGRLVRRYAISELRYLQAATALRGTGESGQACIQWAAALALDLRQGLLTFGTTRAATPEELVSIPGASPVPFIHAWVEIGQTLYAPTTLARTDWWLVPFDRDDYYTRNGVTDVHRLARARFEAIVKRWGLAAALKHGAARAGSGQLADALLQAAGVRYVVGEGRGVLPAPKL
jgi:hypothetical protein